MDARNKVVFPISPTIFSEFMKNEKPKDRITFAKLVDMVSDGLSIRTDAERSALELEFSPLNRTKKGSFRTPPIWTKVSWVIGVPSLNFPGCLIFVNNAINKAFMDETWDKSAEDWIGSILSMPNFDQSESSAAIINSILAQQQPAKSYKDAYMQMLSGAFVAQISAIQNVDPSCIKFYNPTKDELNSDIVKFVSDVDFRKSLPFVTIPASLFTTMWWNKGRSMKANDTYDFQHASIALPYCDAFFTDKSLKATIDQSPDRLASVFDCNVIADPNEAIHYLMSL